MRFIDNENETFDDLIRRAEKRTFNEWQVNLADKEERLRVQKKWEDICSSSFKSQNEMRREQKMLELMKNNTIQQNRMLKENFRKYCKRKGAERWVYLGL